MHKQPLQDVIVKQRPRLERDGSHRPLARPQDVRRERLYDMPQETILPERPSRGFENSLNERGGPGKRSKPWLIIALGIGAVVLGVSFMLSIMFAGATVTVYPRAQQTAVQGTFSARSSTSASGLSFERMTIERTASKELPAEAERMVEDRASGKVTIYNEFSDRPQRLIKNTRFASPEGKVYRIRESVEVPGGNTEKPGTAEATVYAEEAGEAYNKGPTDFSIPGLDGLPQEGKVYARSTGVIEGGFSGMRRQVSEEARSVARTELEAKLKEELLAAAFSESNKPVGHYLYKDAVFFEYVEGQDEFVGDTSVRVTLVGRLHGILFPTEHFDAFLAQETISGYDDTPVRLQDPEALEVRVTGGEGSSTATPTDSSLADSTSEEAVSAEPWKADTLTVTVRGTATFIWTFDEEMLAKDLAGQEKSRMYEPEATSILSAYPGIDRAQATIRPFWRSTFPEDPFDVKIVTKLDS